MVDPNEPQAEPDDLASIESVSSQVSESYQRIGGIIAATSAFAAAAAVSNYVAPIEAPARAWVAASPQPVWTGLASSTSSLFEVVTSTSILTNAFAAVLPALNVGAAIAPLVDLQWSPVLSGIDWAKMLPTNLLGDVHIGHVEGLDFDAMVASALEDPARAASLEPDAPVRSEPGVPDAAVMERLEQIDAKLELLLAGQADVSPQGKVGVVRIVEVSAAMFGVYVFLRDDVVPTVSAAAAAHGPTVVAWIEQITQQPQ